MAYMNVSGARSTRFPLSGLGCGCTSTSGLGIDDATSRTGALIGLAAGAAGVLWLLSTSSLAMNRRRRLRTNAGRRRSPRRRTMRRTRAA